MSKFRNYDKYEVYEDGRIWSYKYKKFLKPVKTRDGYQQVCLYDNEGNKKMYKLHRVVFEAVTGKPIPQGMEINHISEAKDENFFENLELVTHKQNVNFGTRNERIGKAIANNTNRSKAISKAMKNNPKISKQVGAFQDGKLVMTFPSTNEAQRQGFNQGNVAKCCNGNRNTHKGYEWRYL